MGWPRRAFRAFCERIVPRSAIKTVQLFVVSLGRFAQNPRRHDQRESLTLSRHRRDGHARDVHARGAGAQHARRECCRLSSRAGQILCRNVALSRRNAGRQNSRIGCGVHDDARRSLAEHRAHRCSSRTLSRVLPLACRHRAARGAEHDLRQLRRRTTILRRVGCGFHRLDARHDRSRLTPREFHISARVRLRVLVRVACSAGGWPADGAWGFGNVCAGSEKREARNAVRGSARPGIPH